MTILCLLVCLVSISPAAITEQWEITRLFPHIRTWATAYHYSNNIPEDKQSWMQWMADHYDVIVWDDKNHPDVRALRPSGAHFIYSNYNNLGPQESASWNHFMLWSGEHISDASRYENMFLHMRQDHTKTWNYGDDTFDQYLDRVWIYDENTRQYTIASWAARDAATNYTLFKSPGSILYAGMTEGRFKEIVFTLTNYGSGLAIQWEYWDGYKWKELTDVEDETNNLSQNGKVTFFPPSDWERTKITSDTTSAYYIRGTTSSVITSPIETTVFSEDYVPLINKVYYIKGWDPANDKNGDGFIDNAEFVSLVNSQATARFRHQSRHAYQDSTKYYGRRWMLNVGNADVTKWNESWLPYLVQYQNGKDTGVFEDNSILWMGYAPNNFFWEFSTSDEWYTRNGQVWATLKNALSPSLLNINVGDIYGYPAIDNYGGGADLLQTESWLEGRIDRYENKLAEIKKRATVLKYPTLIEGRVTTIDGSEDRNRIFTLATYYLQAYDYPNAPTFFYYGGRDWRNKDNRIYNWFRAIEYNIGKSLGNYYVFTTGQDPEKATLNYKIFAREYSNALILTKPLPYGLWQGKWQTGSPSVATTTTHPLSGTYRILNADGTLSDPVNQVTLRNNEGVILIKPATSSNNKPLPPSDLRSLQ